MQEWLVAYLLGQGVPAAQVEWAATAAMVLAVVVLSVIANFVAKRIIVRILTAVVRRTANAWDDVLVQRQVFERLSHLAPGLVIYHMTHVAIPFWPVLESLVKRGALIYMVVVVALVVDAVLSALSDIYDTFEVAKVRPIRSFVQVVKIIAYIVAIILSIALAIDRSPVVILSGLGALSAIALLVFKDSILGLVASIQFSALDLVRKGDWIEVPQYGADGDVIDISLTAVRVQNWDKTFTVIPTHALASGSYKNWRGMQETGGRRIMRAIHLDQQSVRFCTEEELDRFESIALIRDYVRTKREEVDAYNAELNLDLHQPVNGRRLTNLGTFRAYVAAYLKHHPGIHQGMLQIVRQLAPNEHGVPIQLYCFTNTTAWVEYEPIQSDIFDHLLAIVPYFGLKVFQAPSGADVQRLGEGGLTLSLPLPEDPPATTRQPSPAG